MRFSVDQASDFGAQGVGQGVGKGGEKHPSIGVGPGQKNSPVQGNDGFSRACRARYPCGAAVFPLHPLPLLRMEEDSPFLPGIGQGAFQLFNIVDDPEPALGIGMVER